MNIGQNNTLTVVKSVPFGMYLDGGKYGEILIPKRYIPEGCQDGDEIDVFIYLDSEDRLIATTETPKAKVGEVAHLKVVDVTSVGVFLDWGLPKDLLVPKGEQGGIMEVGESYVVYVYLDEATESIAATARLERYLHEQSFYFKAHQPVDLLISAKTDLGYKAVVDDTHLGLLYENEVFQPLHVGDRVKGFIKQVRSDNLIDLTLQSHPGEARDELMEAILTHLKEEGGHSRFTDKSSPDDIYIAFKMSKKNFKKALGALYKQKLILIEKDGTRLVGNP